MRSPSSVNASGRIFSATSRLSFVSRARYTSPMPPAPRAVRISYGPIRDPKVRDIGYFVGTRCYSSSVRYIIENAFRTSDFAS